MNLERILLKYPDADCRRIDLLIGEKPFWGRGIGTRVIRLLTRFAFWQEAADLVFGCDVADYNVASRKAFQKAGFQIDAAVAQPAAAKAQVCYDLVISKGRFLEISGAPPGEEATDERGG